MLTIVQLEDGCYLITVDFSYGGHSVHWEKVMKEVESNAMPLEGGEKIRLSFYSGDK